LARCQMPDVELVLIVSRDRFCVAGAKLTWAWAMESWKQEVGKHLHAVAGRGVSEGDLTSQDKTPLKVERMDVEYRSSPRSCSARIPSQTHTARTTHLIPRPSSSPLLQAAAILVLPQYVLRTVRSESRALKGAPHPSSATLFRNITRTSRPLLLTRTTDRQSGLCSTLEFIFHQVDYINLRIHQSVCRLIETIETIGTGHNPTLHLLRHSTINHEHPTPPWRQPPCRTCSWTRF
jgi:hypothetical protein